MKDAVHAGRMAIFKHPMNFKEECLSPCIGDGAYTEEEQAWWNGTLSYLGASLDVDGRQLCLGGRVLATPRPRPPPGGAAAAGAGAERGRARARPTLEEASQDLTNTESENDIVETTKPKNQKRVRSQSR